MFRRRRRASIAGILLILAVLLAACGGSAGNSGTVAKSSAKSIPPVPVKFAFYATETPWNIPILLAIKTGIFAKEGLDVTTSVYNGGIAVNQALAAGAADMGFDGAVPDITAIVKGAKNYLYLDVQSPDNAEVGVASNITSIQELNGKKFGVIAAGSLQYAQALAIEQAAHIHMDIVVTGPQPLTAGLLRSSKISGMILSPPSNVIQTASGGIRVLGPMSSYHELPYIYTSGIVTRSFADAHPVVLHEILAGYFAAVKYAQAHPNYTKGLIASAWSITPGLASKVYEAYVPTFQQNLTFSPSAVTASVEMAAKLGLIPAAVVGSSTVSPQSLVWPGELG